MVILEFKLKGKQRQYTALDEAIRTTQFIRNKCVRLWQDAPGTTPADLNKYCRVLAHEYDFVHILNSMARQRDSPPSTPTPMVRRRRIRGSCAAPSEPSSAWDGASHGK